MRQKLAIARAVLHDPAVIFLDEPTSGLDPEASRVVRDFIKGLRGQGRTIFLTTHNLPEADELCDIVGVFRTQLLRIDTPANLRASLFGHGTNVRVAGPATCWIAVARALPFVRDVTAVDSTLAVSLDDPEEQNPGLIRALVDAGAPIRSAEPTSHTLEDVYLELLDARGDGLVGSADRQGLSVRHVLIVLQKEFQEITQQRGLVAGIIAPAIILTVVTLVSISGAAVVTGDSGLALGHPVGLASLAGLTAQEASQAFIGMQVSVLFLLMPSLLTSIIAAHSIIGEKTSRTLEPMLATPIRTWELLIGKGLASAIPGVGLTWLSGGIFLYGLSQAAVSERVMSVVASPGWYVTFFPWTPLLAVVAIAMIVMLSSRVNDQRAAQQLASAVVLPFLVIFLGQASGWIVLGVGTALTIAAILLVLALGFVVGAITMFRREAILTRWK